MAGQRKIQAPKRRETPKARPEARSRQIIIAAAAAGVAALAIVVGVLAFGGGDASEDLAATLEAAGCTYESFEAQEGTHTADFDAKPDWNSSPPTSGEHHEQPAIIGTYDDPINVIQAVHNLEHGAIVVYWGEDVPEAEVDAVKGFVADDPTGMVAAPLPELDGRIALTAWSADPEGSEAERRGTGHLAKCERYDAEAFESFRDTFRFKGPERFPPEALEPGS